MNSPASYVTPQNIKKSPDLIEVRSPLALSPEKKNYLIG